MRELLNYQCVWFEADEAPLTVPDEPLLAAGEAPLSCRELAVLSLITQGLSNQEIAERLFISLHTVKTHARRINGKLGVERRTQAVARAKGLGLL
ncbi:HTH-type transcriptional regulator MalT [compost metagenome]